MKGSVRPQPFLHTKHIIWNTQFPDCRVLLPGFGLLQTLLYYFFQNLSETTVSEPENQRNPKSFAFRLLIIVLWGFIGSHPWEMGSGMHWVHWVSSFVPLNWISSAFPPGCATDSKLCSGSAICWGEISTFNIHLFIYKFIYLFLGVNEVCFPDVNEFCFLDRAEGKQSITVISRL